MANTAPAKALLLPAPPSSAPRAATAHLLPCRIQHDGPLALPAHLWQPSGLCPPPAAPSEADAQQGAPSAIPAPPFCSPAKTVSLTLGPGPVAAANGANGEEEKKADDAPLPPPVVHFRGRRLVGAEVRVPEGYRGVAMRVAGVAAPAPEGSGAAGHVQGDGEEDEEENIETGATEQVAEFERMVVWRHDVAADRVDDRYVRGIEEWVGFATAVSGGSGVLSVADVKQIHS
jgi:hypothetical protein